MRPFNDRLAELSKLATSTEAIRTAACLIPVPLNDGGIQLEIHADGGDLEVEIDPNGSIRAVTWNAAPRHAANV